MIAYIAFSPILCAVPVYFIGRRSERARDRFLFAYLLTMVAACLGLVIRSWSAPVTLFLSQLCGGMRFCADPFRALYALIACVMWLVSFFLSGEYFAHYRDRDRYFMFTLFTLTGTAGFFLADDLLTAFIFFEVMSISGYAWVAHDEKPASLAAARTYLALSVASGMVTLMGLMMIYRVTGSLAYDSLSGVGMTPYLWSASALSLVGFATKAAVFPLHVWLPKAHPVAPAPASALLSGVLTKTGVLGIIVITGRLWRGHIAAGVVLMVLGLVTLCVGAVLALFSVNLKRTLACSSMSQIGYILTGIAAGLVLDEVSPGVIGHMVNHSMFKLLLFGCAGVIYMNTHTLDLNELKGYGRGRPFLCAMFVIGAWGIACLPGLSGFVGKTLLHETIAECAHISPWFKVGEWVFLTGAGVTTAYMLKLFVILFLDEPARDFKKPYARFPSRAALIVPAAWIVIAGVLPGQTLIPLAQKAMGHFHAPAFYSGKILLEGMVSPAIGVVLYFTVVRRLLTGRDGKAFDPLDGKKDLEALVTSSRLVNGAGHLFMAVCSVLDGWLSSRPALFTGKLMTRVSSFLDGILSGRTLSLAGDILTFPLRAADELSDEAVLLLRALFFRNRAEGAVMPESVLTRMSDRAWQARRRRLQKLPHPHRRDAQDMSYGTRITNAVSFGLLIGAIGILFALIAVLYANR